MVHHPFFVDQSALAGRVSSLHEVTGRDVKDKVTD